MAKLRSLRTCPIFEDLSYRDLAVLAPHVSEEEADAEAWVAKEGEASQGLIIVKSGRVRLFLSSQPEEGVDLGPGEYFGELSLSNGGRPRAVAAKALEKCEYLKLTPQAYLQLRTSAPQVAMKISEGALASMAKWVSAAKGAI